MILTHPQGWGSICLEKSERPERERATNRGTRASSLLVGGILNRLSVKHFTRDRSSEGRSCGSSTRPPSFAGFVGNATNVSRLSSNKPALFLIKLKMFDSYSGSGLVGQRSLSGHQWTLWRHRLGSDGCKMPPLTTARRDWVLGSCCSIALIIFCLFDVKR